MPGVERGRVAASGGMWHKRRRARAHVALLLSMIALGCGNERPPWNGFDLFPPDASTPELSPDLQARLNAAAAAFLADPDAGHADGPAPAVPSSSDAGVKDLPRMAAESEGRSPNSQTAGRPMMDAGMMMEMPARPPVRRGAAGARSFPPRWPFDFDAAIGPWSAGRAGSMANGATEADADAGATEPAADGGR